MNCACERRSNRIFPLLILSHSLTSLIHYFLLMTLILKVSKFKYFIIWHSNSSAYFATEETELTEIKTFSCNLRAVGSKVPQITVFDKDNFTFTSLPNHIKTHWLELAQAKDISTMDDLAKKRGYNNFFFNTFMDWMSKKAADDATEGTSKEDKKFIAVAFKVQVYKHLTFYCSITRCYIFYSVSRFVC